MGFYDQIQAARTVNRAMQRYSAFELLPLEILTQIFRELDEFHFTDHFEYPYKRNSTRWYSANASLVSWRVRHAVIPSLFANLRFSLAAENGVDRPTYPPLFSELSRRFAKRVYFCTEVAKGHTLLQSDFLDYAMAEFIDMMPNLRSLRISTKIRPGPNLCIAMGQIGFQRKGTVTLDHTYSHKPTTVEVFERPPGRAHKFSLSSMLSLPHFATLTTPNLLAIENIFALNFTEKYEQDGSLHALRTPAFFDNRLPKPATEIPTPVGPTYSLRLKINSLRLADPDKYSNLSDYKHSREFDTALTGFYLSPLLLRNLQSLINFSNLCTLEISTLSEYYLFDTAYDTSTDGRQPFFTNPEIFPNLRRLTYEGALWEFLELLCDDVHHAVVPRGSQFLSELCYREGVGLRETDVESNLDTMVRYYASDFGAAPHSPQFLSIRAAAACQSYPECSYRPNYDDEEHEYLHNLGCFKRLKRLEIGICLCTPVIEQLIHTLNHLPDLRHLRLCIEFAGSKVTEMKGEYEAFLGTVKRIHRLKHHGGASESIHSPTMSFGEWQRMRVESKCELIAQKIFRLVHGGSLVRKLGEGLYSETVYTNLRTITFDCGLEKAVGRSKDGRFLLGFRKGKKRGRVKPMRDVDEWH